MSFGDITQTKKVIWKFYQGLAILHMPVCEYAVIRQGDW